MTHLLQPKIFTVAEYYRLAEVGILKDTDKVELINGEIITMSPINSPHAATVNGLTLLIFEKLGSKVTTIVQNPIRLSNNSEPEPDLVIAKYRKNFYYDNHPTPEDIYIVIEVSDSTLEKDRTIKAPLYATASIPEYWIVNLVDKQIEIYRQPKKGEYYFKQIIFEVGEELQVERMNLTLKYEDIFTDPLS